jgi:transcriptional regulator with XRE-family HTH domain
MNTNNGERFRLARERAGLSQDEAAAELGCTRQAIGAWERGKALPGARRLAQVCTTYGCTPNELLYGAPPPEVHILPLDMQAKAAILLRVFERPGAPDPYPALRPAAR